METMLTSYRRICAGICRLRRSWGFGVHSPFMFSLLKDVFREDLPYYAYDELKQLSRHPVLKGYSESVNRLLFRLANRFQPVNIVEVGTGDGRSMAYLSAAKSGIPCITLGEDEPYQAYWQSFFSVLPRVDFRLDKTVKELPSIIEGLGRLGILHVAQTLLYEEAVAVSLPYVDSDTLFVIGNIRSSADKYAWWRRLVADKRCGVAVDLYDVGLVFFDQQQIKRTYKMMI